MGIVPEERDDLDVGIASILADWEKQKQKDFIELLQFASKRPKLFGVEVSAILKTAEQFGLDLTCIYLQSFSVHRVTSLADATRAVEGMIAMANDMLEERSVPLCEVIIIHMKSLRN